MSGQADSQHEQPQSTLVAIRLSSLTILIGYCMGGKGVTQEQIAFAADVRARDEKLIQYCREQGFTDTRTGWTSYFPEQVAHLNPPTNEERSRAEVIEFSAKAPAGPYVAYLSADRQR